MSESINILVASRQDKDRKHILSALSHQKNFIIAGVEKDEVGAIIKSEQLKPDVLIIDLHPFKMGELDLAAIIHRKTPSTSIIMICDKNEKTNRAFYNGIRGFLLKETDADEIIFAILAAFKGSGYISGSCLQHSCYNFMLEKQPMPIPLTLSPAERGIVYGIAMGLSDTQIAQHLNFSAGTIRNTVLKIKQKTNLKNRVQIVLFSLVNGIIKPDLLNTFKNHIRKFNPETSIKRHISP